LHYSLDNMMDGVSMIVWST